MDPSACRRLIQGYQQGTGATLALRGTPIGYRVDRPDVQVTGDFHPAKVALDGCVLRGCFQCRFGFAEALLTKPEIWGYPGCQIDDLLLFDEK
jgi:hypothetical protein